MRGTPQQIIDKYNQLARDAQLSGDRVATENFQQHAEHYLRLLADAQREQDARREEQERQNRERQAERDRERAERQEREAASGKASDPGAQPQPDTIEVVEGGGQDSGLVETPESAPKKTTTRKPRAPRPPKAKAEPKAEAKAEAKDEPAETPAADGDTQTAAE